MSETLLPAPDENPVTGVMIRGKARRVRWGFVASLIWLALVTAVPVLELSHDMLSLIVPGLALVHLILSAPAWAFPDKLRQTAQACDVLSIPIPSAVFAWAFHRLFWQAAFWCGGLALAGVAAVKALSDKPLVGGSEIGACLLLGFCALTGQWVFFWGLVRSHLWGPSIVALCLATHGLLVLCMGRIGIETGFLVWWSIGFWLMFDCARHYRTRITRQLMG